MEIVCHSLPRFPGEEAEAQRVGAVLPPEPQLAEGILGRTGSEAPRPPPSAGSASTYLTQHSLSEEGSSLPGTFKI